jgi:hypothetical protein
MIYLSLGTIRLPLDTISLACGQGPIFSHFREQPDFLRIDAICIDQSQMQERNHHVAKLGNIYSNARDVLVWLGLSTSAIASLL